MGTSASSKARVTKSAQLMIALFAAQSDITVPDRSVTSSVRLIHTAGPGTTMLTKSHKIHRLPYHPIDSHFPNLGVGQVIFFLCVCVCVSPMGPQDWQWMKHVNASIILAHVQYRFHPIKNVTSTFGWCNQDSNHSKTIVTNNLIPKGAATWGCFSGFERPVVAHVSTFMVPKKKYSFLDR